MPYFCNQGHKITNIQMKKYIIHYPVLKDRKEYIESAITDGTASDIVFVSDWNRSDGEEALYNNEIKYLPDRETWIKKSKNYYAEMPLFRYMSLGEIACGLSHIHTWKKIADHGDGLVLEDDVVFCNYFEEVFNDVLLSMPDDLDVLFIGGGFYHEHVAKTISICNNNFYKKRHPSTNTVCAYMLKQSAAQKLCDIVKDHTLPIDFEMNYLFDILNFNVYHHIPYIVQVGSNAGIYKSCNR